MSEFKRLATVVEKTVGGGTPDRSNPEFWNGGIPWASVKDFKDGNSRLSKIKEQVSEKGLRLSSSHLIEAGTPIVCTRMAVGRLARAEVPVAINQDLRALYLYEHVDSDYFIFAFDHIRPQIESISVGSTVKGIRLEQLLDFEIFTPPLPEQAKIAEVLSTVDRGIEQTEALIAKQQRIKTGLMADLLTRGIDEHGNLRSEATHTFKDSPLGRIPVEWEVSNVDGQFDIKSGFCLGQHRIPQDNARPYLRVANVQRGFVSLEDISEMDVSDEEMKSRNLLEDDLMIVEGHADIRQIGRCARVPLGAVGFTFQNHLFRLRPTRMSSRFADIWLNSPQVQDYWRVQCSTSSGLNTINRSMLGRVPVIVLEAEEERRVVSSFEAFDGNYECAMHDLQKLRSLKTALMQDLLTGKVRVTDLLDTEVAG
jgi:type I restriction enzyme S subunit